MQIDIRDVQPQHLQGFEAVVHLAALSNDPLSNLKPEITNEINFAASVRLAQFAKDAGVSRFLFSSSCAIYGKAGADLLDETAEIAPVTPYNISKLRVEQELTKLASDRFSPTFLRNATAYGVSPRHSFELVLNNLVAWAYTTGRVFIKSDGSPWRPIVHIEDISRAFLAVLSAPRNVVHNQALNVGRNDENYSIRELAEIVQQVVPGSQVEYAKDGGPDARSYRVDFSKIQRLVPDFKPQWDGRRGASNFTPRTPGRWSLSRTSRGRASGASTTWKGSSPLGGWIPPCDGGPHSVVDRRELTAGPHHAAGIPRNRQGTRSAI